MDKAEPTDKAGCMLSNAATPRPSGKHSILTLVRRRLVSGTGWTLVGSGVHNVMALVSYVVLARLMGRDTFGEFAIIQRTIMIFGGLGLGWTATRFVAAYRETDKTRTGNIIGLCASASVVTGGFLSILLFVGSARIASDIVNASHLVAELRIAAAALFFFLVAANLKGALIGFEAFKELAFVQAVTAVVMLTSLVVGASVYGMYGAVSALAITWSINATMSFFVLRRSCRHKGVHVRIRGCLKEKKILLVFALPAFIASTAMVQGEWVASAILAQQPHGYGELGLYHAADKWRAVIVYVPTIVGNVSLSILSNLHGERDKASMRSVYLFGLVVNLAISFGIAGLVMLFSKTIMSAFGADFEVGWKVVVVLAWVAVLISIAEMQKYMIISSGRMWAAALMNVMWGGLVVVLGLFLLPREGAIGFAISMLVAYFVLCAVQFAFVWTRNLKHAL